MKTFGGVILNLIAFFGIWLLAAFIAIAVAFRGWGDSGIGEYLRLGTAWFICPGIGGFYAPKITKYFIQDLNIDSVVASFITIISIVFFLFMGFSIFTYGSQFGGEVSEMVQLVIQFSSIIVGTLMGKVAVKSNV